MGNFNASKFISELNYSGYPTEYKDIEFELLM